MGCRRLLGSMIAGLAVSAVTPALGQVFEGPDGRSVTVYGQLNAGIQYYDDGEDSFTNLTDSNVSTSRLGLNYDIPIGDNRLRFNFETSLGFPRSDNFSQTDDADFDWQRTNLRRFEAIYSGDSFGVLYLGQGGMATDGLSGEGFSDTGVVASPDPSSLAGDFQFRDKAGMLSGVEIGDAYTDFDGPRRFRIRYDTPELAGFTLSAAYGVEVLDSDNDSDFYDVGLRYAGTTGDFEVAAGVGYLWEDPDDGGSTVGTLVASGGVRHTPSGVSLNLAGGEEDDGGSYIWAQIGWQGDLIDAGRTSVSLDYWDGSDFNVDGSSSDALTFSVVQRIAEHGLEIYGALRRYGYDDDVASYDDGTLAFAGVRWRF